MSQRLKSAPAHLTFGVLLSMLLWSGPLLAADPALQPAPSPEITIKPDITALGNGRYRVGPVMVDKAARRFTLRGKFLDIRPDAPLEFIAAATKGYKAYESLLELEANAFEFNLACILIGLDKKRGLQPTRHFDDKPAEGDPVTVVVEWEHAGKKHRVDAMDLIRLDKGRTQINKGWVYTGSGFDNAGIYMAHLSGVLIGFVNDRDSIIQHRSGLGLGNYGAVTYRPELVPPSGTAITLIVENPNKN